MSSIDGTEAPGATLITSPHRRLILTALSVLITSALAVAVNLATSWMDNGWAWAGAVALTVAAAAVTYALNSQPHVAAGPAHQVDGAVAATSAPEQQRAMPATAPMPSIHQQARNNIAGRIVQIGEVHGDADLR
ncbi:hypothetical protein AB0I37_29935 [Micromonospora purpureochromogenes]|uniref:hypothetical protein n=1 Tax=Micromonospora purpureochromogenes TaxID=47872 RepID=UPI00340D7A9D